MPAPTSSDPHSSSAGAPDDARDRRGGGGARDVLVVDDNEAVARGLARMLDKAGYVPIVFHRGGDALDHLAAVGHPPPPPAAALIDIHLPDISGLVLIQKLREQLGPDTPILVLSGDTSMATLNSLPHVGATYFYSKPVNAQQLIDRLNEWVG